MYKDIRNPPALAVGRFKERPIPFTAYSIIAILEGRKTQTRRVINMTRRHLENPDDFVASGIWRPYATRSERCYWHYGGQSIPPRYSEGDILWVRERWRIDSWDEDTGSIAVGYKADGYSRCELQIPYDDDGEIFNRYWIDSSDELHAKGIEPDADGDYDWGPGESPCRWRSARHMPRWASRILLRLTDVRVERLQDISEEDAQAEGVCREFEKASTFYLGYKHLWDELNAKRGFRWEENPFVWALTFEIVEAAQRSSG